VRVDAAGRPPQWAQEKKMRLILGLVLSCLAFGAASAEESAASAPTSPDLADIMAGAQWRQLKLSFAGAQKNWPLAEYEIGLMRKNFAEAAKFYPEFDKVPLAKLIGEISEPALDEVAASVKAKDEAAFKKSFARLTEACNSCHQAAGKGFIKIRVPTLSPFSNQVFAPER
jgi:cytochrome c553